MSKLNDDLLVEKSTISRYSKRFKELGRNVKTLGWGTKEQQTYRFMQTINSNIDLTDKDILDIGCGFGDYASFLEEYSVKFKSYLGIDINPELINEAKDTFSNSKDISFELLNLKRDKSNIRADIGIMIGVLNLNLKEEYDNLRYSKEMIQNAFNLVNEVLVIDFLSSQLTRDYPEEEFVYYHSPEEVLNFAFTLSSNVVLKHNYNPIPQKEFILYIYKD